MPVVFAGDFTQLEPVGAKPLHLDQENELWHKTVTTFIELRTNHRFNKDKPWGDMLAGTRELGASANDPKKSINGWCVHQITLLKLTFQMMLFVRPPQMLTPQQ